MDKSNTEAAYLEAYKQTLDLRNFSPKTIKSYYKCIQSFFNYSKLHSDPSLLYVDYVKSYLLDLKKQKRSWSTINVNYSALKLFCVSTLNRVWDIEHLPRPKSAKKLFRILSKQEVVRLIESPRSLKHRTILFMLYATGIRKSELINIKIGDIDSDRLELYVCQGKGNKDRIVQLPPCVIPILRAYYTSYRPKEYLFEGQSETSAKYSASSIHKILRRAKIKTNIRKRVCAHALRHCYATHHLESGTDLVFIKEQLGHRNLSTTEKYLHLCGEIQRLINHPIEHLHIEVIR